MQKLNNKIKLPELSGMESLTPRPGERTYSKILVAAFCLFVLVVLVVGIFVNSYLDGFAYKTPSDNFAIPNLENASWKIRKVTPTETSDSFTLDLKSSIGNLRSYEGVKSYGISSTGKYLAMTTARGLEVVDLAVNTAQLINTPFDIAGDEGDIISWSHNDDYFALPVFNAEDNAPHLLLFSQNGTSVKDFTPDLAYRREAGKIIMYPVLFSPKGNHILVRNFDETDSSASQIDNKAVLLTVLNTEGKNVWEHDARDSSDNTEVLYYWSADGNYIYFTVVPDNTVINYANQNLFTKVLVEISN